MKNKVSVIITTYNDADYLNKSIGSVINQTYKDIELLIIDDGSFDDKAEKIAYKIQKNTDVPIIYYKKKNGGPSSARNFGIEKATGEYIIFLDADDELLPNSIEWRVNTIKSLDDSYGLVYGTAITVKNGKKKKENYIDYDGFLLKNSGLIGRTKGIPGAVLYYIFKTNILKRINFNEKLSFNEDFELLLNIAKEKKFFGRRVILAKRYIRNDSWSKQKKIKAYQGVLQFLRIAENNKLLELEEIKKRRKENNLSLIKKLIKERKVKETLPYINEAFKEIPPLGFKEYIIYMWNRLR